MLIWGGQGFPIVLLFWGVWVFPDLSMLSGHAESLETFEGLRGFVPGTLNRTQHCFHYNQLALQ